MVQMMDKEVNIQSSLSSEKKVNQLIAWSMVAIAALFYSYEFILRVTPSTMFDELIAFYHINATDVNNVVIFYTLAYTPMQLIVGPLLDRYGVKRLLIFAVLCCIFGSYLLSAVSSIWACSAGLFLMGLGSAFAFVSVLKLAAGTVNRKYLALASGITTAIGMLGAICGQFISAYINLHFDWHYTWLLYAIIGLLIFIVIIVFIKEPVQTPEEIKISKSQSFFKQLVLLAQNKTVLLCGLIGSVLYMPISVFGSLWGVPYLTNLFSNISTLEASNTIAMVFIGMVIGCPLAGILSRHIAGEKLLIHGSISVVILSTVLIFITTNLSLIGTILLLIGSICGAEALTFTIAVENSPKHLAASAVAFVNFIMMSISGIMQFIVGCTLNHFWEGTIINGIPKYDTGAYQAAISTVPLLSAIFTLVFICGIFQSKRNKTKNISGVTHIIRR